MGKREIERKFEEIVAFAGIDKFMISGAEHGFADGLGAARADGGGGSRSSGRPRGVAYLAASQGEDGFWTEPFHTATGFPRVFYLRYHGYSKFFPLWALARYGTSSAATVARRFSGCNA